MILYKNRKCSIYLPKYLKILSYSNFCKLLFYKLSHDSLNITRAKGVENGLSMFLWPRPGINTIHKDNFLRGPGRRGGGEKRNMDCLYVRGREGQPQAGDIGYHRGKKGPQTLVRH